MAFPYHLWGQPHHYAVPAILPSNNPLVSKPEGAIRDFVEHCTNGDRTSLCDANQLEWFKEWAKNDDYRKLIMAVLKSRLDLGWPYNYKALDLLAVMPSSELLPLNDQLAKLADIGGGGEGSAEVKKLAKPLVDKVKAEQGKQEAEEMKKKEEAVLAMWGGMWANNGGGYPQLAAAGWGGYPYPYAAAGIPPGVAPAPVEWKSKAPEGWQPYVHLSSPTPNPAPSLYPYPYPHPPYWPASRITPTPQIYPFSRAGYYGWMPEPKPEPPKQAAPGWWVGVHMGQPT